MRCASSWQKLVAIGAERRAIEQDTAGLVAQIDTLQDHHVEMQQRMAAMQRQWFAGNATDGAADTQEELFELRLRMATLTRQWVAREISSAPARQASQERQPDPAGLTGAAPGEAVACLA